MPDRFFVRKDFIGLQYFVNFFRLENFAPLVPIVSLTQMGGCLQRVFWLGLRTHNGVIWNGSLKRLHDLLLDVEEVVMLQS